MHNNPRSPEVSPNVGLSVLRVEHQPVDIDGKPSFALTLTYVIAARE